MNQIMLLIQKIQKLPSWFNGLTALFLCFLLGYIDSTTSVDLFILYLIPVSLAILLANIEIGVIVSGAAFAFYFGLNYFANPVDPHTFNTASAAILFVAFTGLNIKLRQTMDENRDLKANDDLTGLLNSKAFFQRAEEELQRSHRYKRPVTLAYLDCSQLKRVKKEQSFKMERDILLNISQIMKEHLRTTDLFARVDDESFLILLPEVNANGAKTALQKIQSLIRLKSIAENWPLEFNIGAITFREPPLDMQSILASVSSMVHNPEEAASNYLLHEQVYN
ncbi:hypothetical protein DRI50_01885 [candidate division KSB1 bacterium]|nr:MAG: hypothetical protein DRI50_01885 [candidate division KSB1 bacterium]